MEQRCLGCHLKVADLERRGRKIKWLNMISHGIDVVEVEDPIKLSRMWSIFESSQSMTWIEKAELTILLRYGRRALKYQGGSHAKRLGNFYAHTYVMPEKLVTRREYALSMVL